MVVVSGREGMAPHTSDPRLELSSYPGVAGAKVTSSLNDGLDRSKKKTY